MRGEAVSGGVAASRFSDSSCSDGQFDSLLRVLLRSVMPPQLARARVEGRLCGGKEILPDQVAGKNQRNAKRSTLVIIVEG